LPAEFSLHLAAYDTSVSPRCKFAPVNYQPHDHTVYKGEREARPLLHPIDDPRDLRQQRRSIEPMLFNRPLGSLDEFYSLVEVFFDRLGGARPGHKEIPGFVSGADHNAPYGGALTAFPKRRNTHRRWRSTFFEDVATSAGGRKFDYLSDLTIRRS
jgi:hypothetical protein